MIVDEEMLAPFRGEDGLCVLRRDFRQLGIPLRYENYFSLIEKARHLPRPVLESGLNPSFTFEVFRGMWSQAERGHRTVPVFAFMNRIPALPTSRRWLALRHEGGGHACRGIEMIATILHACDAVQEAFDGIAAENYWACNGWFEDSNISQTVTQRYVTRVADLGLNSGEEALKNLCESLYPVDATAMSLQRISAHVDDLLPLLKNPEALPTILFLAENSD